MNNILPGISVIMPSYNQANFISNAIESVKAQTYTNWELIIINDNSTDNSADVIRQCLPHSNVRYFENVVNKGLGACLNIGINMAHGDLIAYLPSDDLYYEDHLMSLHEKLLANDIAILAYSGLRHHGNAITTGIMDNNPLQLVQVLHRKTGERWMERQELDNDDLNAIYWDKLQSHGLFVQSKKVSCEWVDHPHKRNKIVQEPMDEI